QRSHHSSRLAVLRRLWGGHGAMDGMSDEKTSLVRPRQVTTGALLAAVGSVVLVLSLFDTLGRLRSADTRPEIDDILSGGAGATLGLDTGQVVDILRVLSLVS